MNNGVYRTILRGLALISSLFMWGVSVFFNNKGFGFEIKDAAYVGFGLALCVTVIELVWAKEGMKGNSTLALVGMGAYVYGVWTNMVGIMAYQGISNPDMNNYPFPLALSFFIEVVPEPLFAWAVTGSSKGGDFVGNLMGMLNVSNPFLGKRSGAQAQAQASAARQGGGQQYQQQQRAQQQRAQARAQQGKHGGGHGRQQQQQQQDGYTDRPEPTYHPTDHSLEQQKHQAQNQFGFNDPSFGGEGWKEI